MKSGLRLFYALYFGDDSRRDHQKFVDCFVAYEERTESRVKLPLPPDPATQLDTICMLLRLLSGSLSPRSNGKLS